MSNQNGGSGIELQSHDMSANYGQNGETSAQQINLPPSPVNEIIDEVTETGFNASETPPSSQPEIYFYMKSMIKSSK